MAFFQNANGQTYTRYGGREDTDPETHLTKQSLLKTMERVLKLHENDSVKPWSKYEPEPTGEFTPEQIPPMKKMLSKRKEKCIHCHDVKSAMLHDLKAQGKLRKENVFTYPSPKQLGILIDADDQTKVKAVVPKSFAAKSGLKRGDTITAVSAQRVLTFADFTRVLELTPETGQLNVTFARGDEGKTDTVTLHLPKGWKKSSDPSWRSSTYVMGPNSGFWANQLKPNDIRKRGLDAEGLALRVVVVWGKWARQAGLKNGDIIVEMDGLKDKMTIRQLQTYLQMNRNFGDKVKVTVLRGGKKKELMMTLPDSIPLS